MKALIRKLLNAAGYTISKSHHFTDSYSQYSGVKLKSKRQIVDLESLANISLSIPGMISPHSGQFLYALCYMQELSGDVVEIGSWQGRSACFLANAVKNSKNGRFHAIDHFKGNLGKEKFYVVEKDNLSDLKGNFLHNMEMLGLSDSVNLLDMPNEQAAEQIKNVKIRFLFIDGDHTREGVQKDIDLFFPMLMKGSIVVFDDFAQESAGLLDAVDDLMEEKKFSRIMSYDRTLVLMV